MQEVLRFLEQQEAVGKRSVQCLLELYQGLAARLFRAVCLVERADGWLLGDGDGI